MLSEPAQHLWLQGVTRQGLEGTEQRHRLPQTSGFGLGSQCLKASLLSMEVWTGLGVHDAQEAHQFPGKT